MDEAVWSFASVHSKRRYRFNDGGFSRALVGSQADQYHISRVLAALPLDLAGHGIRDDRCLSKRTLRWLWRFAYDGRALVNVDQRQANPLGVPLRGLPARSMGWTAVYAGAVYSRSHSFPHFSLAILDGNRRIVSRQRVRRSRILYRSGRQR